MNEEKLVIRYISYGDVNIQTYRTYDWLEMIKNQEEKSDYYLNECE